jgi:hypothetical protein
MEILYRGISLMCFLFHKWGKWGVIQEWKIIPPIIKPVDPIVWPDTEIIGFQERKCKKCGKIARRYIREFVI